MEQDLVVDVGASPRGGGRQRDGPERRATAIGDRRGNNSRTPVEDVVDVRSEARKRQQRSAHRGLPSHASLVPPPCLARLDPTRACPWHARRDWIMEA